MHVSPLAPILQYDQVDDPTGGYTGGGGVSTPSRGNPVRGWDAPLYQSQLKSGLRIMKTNAKHKQENPKDTSLRAAQQATSDFRDANHGSTESRKNLTPQKAVTKRIHRTHAAHTGCRVHPLRKRTPLHPLSLVWSGWVVGKYNR